MYKNLRKLAKTSVFENLFQLIMLVRDAKKKTELLRFVVNNTTNQNHKNEDRSRQKDFAAWVSWLERFQML